MPAEVRVVDEADDGALRGGDGRGDDVVADLGSAATCTVAPSATASATAASTSATPQYVERAVGRVGVGQQPELVAADLEAHVERLVEVRPEAEQVGPPLLRRLEVGDGVDDGAESLERCGHGNSVADGARMRR